MTQTIKAGSKTAMRSTPSTSKKSLSEQPGAPAQIAPNDVPLGAGPFSDDLVATRGGAVGYTANRAGDASNTPGTPQTHAFVHVAPRSMPLPVLIAVPHAGRAYPGEVLAQMRDPELSQLRLEDRYIDSVAVEIAQTTGTGLLVAQAPRAMLDLNRARDDIDWDIVAGPHPGGARGQPQTTGSNARAKSGLGLVPRRLPGFGEIWREKLPQGELDRRIEMIHRPYHGFLSRELERIRDVWGAALLVDLHSMPPLRRSQSKSAQSGKNADNPAPHIVVGDRFGASCHSGLVMRAFQYLDARGCIAAHNRPYAGGYVLDRHAAPPRDIHAIQIEVCRSTYLDKELCEPTEAVKPLARMLAGLIRELGAETAGLGASGRMAQAAE